MDGPPIWDSSQLTIQLNSLTQKIKCFKCQVKFHNCNGIKFDTTHKRGLN